MIDLRDGPLTYLITKGEATSTRFSKSSREILSVLELAVVAAVSLIQIREKHITTKQLFTLASEACAVVSGSETKLMVNGRIDVALAAGADGVHLPEGSMPVGAIRNICPAQFLIGASVHSLETAAAARREGADFVLFGPVFDSPGKSGVGLASLANVCRTLGGFPVLAVGGVNRSNYRSVLGSGARGYAAIRYLNDKNVLRELAKTRI
jgi:thiamine-phosphate pyrophosphorylase